MYVRITYDILFIEISMSLKISQVYSRINLNADISILRFSSIWSLILSFLILLGKRIHSGIFCICIDLRSYYYFYLFSFTQARASHMHTYTHIYTYTRARAYAKVLVPPHLFICSFLYFFYTVFSLFFSFFLIFRFLSFFLLSLLSLLSVV